MEEPAAESIRRILDVAMNEAKISSPQAFMQSYLESASNSFANMSGSYDAEDNGDNSLDDSSSSPTLSLPDSFDKKGTTSLFSSQIPIAQRKPKACQECSRLEVSLSKAKADEEGLRFEVNTLQNKVRMSSINAESQKVEITALEERSTRLNALLEVEVATRKINEEKAKKYDQADEERLKLRIENSELRRFLDQKSDVLNKLTSSENAHKLKADDIERAKDLLQLDKVLEV